MGMCQLFVCILLLTKLLLGQCQIGTVKPSESDATCHLQLECLGPKQTDQGRVRIPVRSARGPTGPPGEKGLAGPPGPQGATPKPAAIWVPQPREYQVAFYAGLSRSLETRPTPKECPLIFDTVLLNLGSGYNSTTGQFTAPASGVYVFVLVVSAQSYEKIRCRQRKVIPIDESSWLFNHKPVLLQIGHFHKQDHGSAVKLHDSNFSDSVHLMTPGH
ncbi:unnamed protein product [Echinostoma caproni]|uniref:C1q domain-containing protein n=1 Tax=Echinostoma caproni TaxID=27848 RepID=A0A183AQM4_9TREM|nr:unnamed protein product [Echinostoma caproni]